MLNLLSKETVWKVTWEFSEPNVNHISSKAAQEIFHRKLSFPYKWSKSKMYWSYLQKKKSPSISPQISWFLCPMNLNTHSSNETAIYSYVAPLNNTLTGLNQRPDISQPQTSYSNNYFQLSSNEKFEILKSISVSYANPYAVNQLVSSGQPLGHHYMSSPILSQQLPQVCLIFFFMITMLLLT